MPELSIRQLSRSAFFRFAVVGAVSTVLDIAVLNILTKLGVPVLIAGACGFFVGFSNGYFFNSRYVFQSASRASYIKYFVISVGGLGITELLLDLLHLHLGLGLITSKLIAVVVVVFWNYGLSKAWAFSS